MSIVLPENPNAIALELTGRDYISFSALSTYRQCPLRYYFRYIEDLPEAKVSASLVFGGAIHSVAEFHFNEIMAGGPAPDMDTLFDVYQESWNARPLDMVHFGKTENASKLSDLASRMISAFRRSDFAAPRGKILGVEEELRGTVLAGCPDLLARVDLLVDHGDALVVTDLKTARSGWSQNKVDESAEQLVLYAELAQHLVPN